MKKLCSLLTVFFLLGSAMTVRADYYVAGTMNGWNAGDSNYKMSGSGPYSVTSQLPAGTYQFKVTNGSWSQSWAGYDNDQSNVTLSTEDGNISFNLSTACDVTFYFNASTSKAYVQATAASVPSYTFTSGTTIYYDFTAYSTTGINTYVGGNEAWHGSTSNVIAITLSSAWTVTTSTKLWRSGASGWNDYYCTTLPTEGQDMIISTDGINFTWGTYGGGALPPSSVKLHGNITNPSWADTEEFTLAANEETASLTLSNVAKGNYQFGMKIADSWISNGSAFTRANNSHAVTSGSSGNCTFAADRNGDYTFTWTYATNTLEITYPAIPAQSVSLTGLTSQIVKGSVIDFTATSSGIDNPGYRFYVKEKGGSYGSAVASYTFNSVGEYVVKVEALEDNAGDPVAEDEADVLVYATHTFTNGSTIYIDFSDVSGDKKGVNFPNANAATIGYDAQGAGAVKTVTFTADVTWSTTNTFIKTEKGGWKDLKFIVPEGTQNMVKVAADGESFSWDTYVPEPVLTTDFYLAGSFNGWSPTADRFMKADESDNAASVTVTINEYSNIEFKVVEGGSWCGATSGAITKDAPSVTIASASSGDNISMTPFAAGDYIFTLNLTSRELTVTYPDGDQMPIPVNIFLTGSMNGWATDNNAYKFTDEGDIATLEVTLDAEQEYEFKIYNLGTHLGANYDFKYYWCTDVPFSASGGNAKIYTFKEGTYTFRYKISTQELSIGYPATSSTDVEITSAEYATLYSTTAFDVPNDVEAYVVTGYEGIKLTMARIYRIPAETGVVLHAPAGTYAFYEGEERWMDEVETNLLKGTTADELISNSAIHYVLSYDAAHRVGFYWPTGTGASQGVGEFTNNAGKAYLELNGQSAAVAARRGFAFTEQTDVVTPVENISDEHAATKVLRDGTLLIIRDRQVFNAQGMRIQ